MSTSKVGRSWRIPVYTVFSGGLASSVSEAVAERDWWRSWSAALLAVVAWCLWSELRLHGSRGGPWSRSDTVNVTILLAFAGFTGSAAVFG